MDRMSSHLTSPDIKFKSPLILSTCTHSHQDIHKVFPQKRTTGQKWTLGHTGKGVNFTSPATNKSVLRIKGCGTWFHGQVHGLRIGEVRGESPSCLAERGQPGGVLFGFSLEIHKPERWACESIHLPTKALRYIPSTTGARWCLLVAI